MCNFGRQFTVITVGALTSDAVWQSVCDITVFLTFLTKSEPYLGTSEFWMMQLCVLLFYFIYLLFPSVSAISIGKRVLTDPS